MVQTYQGYFQEDGRFIPDGVMVKMPTRRRAIVNIFNEEEVSETADQRQVQRNAFEEFFAAMDALNKEGIEMLEDEFDSILAERVNITRELDL